MRQAKLGEGGSACDDMTETFGCDPTGERPDRPRLANQPEPSVAWSGGDPGCEAYTGSLAGRVIEPRNRPPCGSRRCDKSGRHHRGAEAGRALAVPPGSESGACGQGSPRNLGGLVVSTGEAARAAAVNDSPGPLARPERAGANRADGGTAKRRKTKRGGTGGEKSESADSTAEVGGTRPTGTRRREAADRIVDCRADRRSGHRASRRLTASPAASGESSETAARGCAPA